MLELLYCFECGDISLGGYVADDLDGTTFLTSTPVQVPLQRAEPVFRRTQDQYFWLRPRQCTTKVTWNHGSNRYGFAPRGYDPLLGALGGDFGQQVTVVTSSASAERTPTLPEVCPTCDFHYAQMNLAKFTVDWYAVRSAPTPPDSRESTQLYLGQLHRSMGDTITDSKTIVFTDSRDDAARTAAGTELNQFRDLVRQLLRVALRDRPDVATAVRHAARRQATDEEQTLYDAYVAPVPVLVEAYAFEARGAASPEDLARIAEFENQHAVGAVAWPELVRRLARQLVDLGQNPAGPAGAAELIDNAADKPWYRAWEPPRTVTGSS